MQPEVAVGFAFMDSRKSLSLEPDTTYCNNSVSANNITRRSIRYRTLTIV